MLKMKKKTKRAHTLMRLIKYALSDYKLQFIIVLISIIISAAASVIGIQFIQTLIDEYITPLIGNQNPNYAPLLQAILMMGLIYLIGIIGTFVYNRLMINITHGTLRKIRKEMFEHMQKLPIGYFDSHSHGETMSTYTNDVDTLRQALSQSIPQVFSALVSMASVLVGMLTTNLYLTVVVLIMVVIMVIVSKFFAKNSSKYFIAQQENISKVDGYIEEMMNGQKVVKVFCYEDRSKERFDRLNEELFQSTTKANSYANTLMPCIANIGNLGYVLVAVIGGVFAVNGVLTIGSIAAFLQYIKAFTNPLAQVSQQLNFVTMALAGAERVFKLIDEPVEEDISLVAKEGQKVSFVGPTGAGKTTITNLINRFYDINEGKIRYDGININKMKKDDLRKSLGMVLQDTHLFTGTIKENIKYGNMDATDEEVIAAAKLANADRFIRHLPHAYDTMISGDGEGLSQGQRQLLAIARAALYNPPVLILDEATSSIDTRTEKIVQDGMDKLMKGRTVFVIAHRLSTIKNSDLIMVLDHGNIIERGNHDELLAKKGMYYGLYTGAIEIE